MIVNEGETRVITIASYRNWERIFYNCFSRNKLVFVISSNLLWKTRNKYGFFPYLCYWHVIVTASNFDAKGIPCQHSVCLIKLTRFTTNIKRQAFAVLGTFRKALRIIFNNHVLQPSVALQRSVSYHVFHVETHSGTRTCTCFRESPRQLENHGKEKKIDTYKERHFIFNLSYEVGFLQQTIAKIKIQFRFLYL